MKYYLLICNWIFKGEYFVVPYEYFVVPYEYYVVPHEDFVVPYEDFVVPYEPLVPRSNSIFPLSASKPSGIINWKRSYITFINTREPYSTYL